MSATDLPSKLDALLGSGLTYKAIAERAKCDISTIFRIRNGQISNPSYVAGTAIDQMHAELAKPSKKNSKRKVA
ncbi:helix-turn-helix domain-containing protein [Pseudomonas putida]|uniref:Helix-turn-helix domain-containing protein n=1 Tax=Pseudomonas putida TaxID=303 RepID=A0AAW4BVR5_PSEPU|nr:helix-turn-helix transcriptional regulator [Pseudomonas putida]MBF8703040.1 helix-turn-helix domain-containing protein [Pseudomonas putida]MBF8736896.1 helix-turn-helix domain-containing protein [Pseudomonas putida]